MQAYCMKCRTKREMKGAIMKDAIKRSLFSKDFLRGLKSNVELVLGA